MEEYRSETSQILQRYREGRITRAECVEALDFALLAAIPDLMPAELAFVQEIVAENAKCMREIDKADRQSTLAASMEQPEFVPGLG